MDGGEEVARGLIITRGDRAKLLELGEEVLDQMACGVHVTIEFSGLPPICLPRDHHGFPRGDEWFNYPLVGVERLIGEQHIGLHVRQKFVCAHQIMSLATGQMKTNRIAEGVYQGVDFGA
jgi:hypothetical protein